MKWKNLNISIAGRLVILKSVLDRILINWLNLFNIPSMIINKIGIIRRDFIWKGFSHNKEKMHLLKWEMIYKEKREGWIGISSIRYMNISWLAKRWWRHRREYNSLWNKSQWANMENESQIKYCQIHSRYLQLWKVFFQFQISPSLSYSTDIISSERYVMTIQQDYGLTAGGRTSVYYSATLDFLIYASIKMS